MTLAPAVLLLAADASAAKIPLDMLIIFACAKLLAELFEALGQPGIVGEITAGVLVGPSVLGWITPNDFLTALADLGVMFLLFRVGLEVKSSELIRAGGPALMVAIAGVVFPFILGFAILTAWGSPRIEAVFVGAAMVATSVGITAQVLASKGLLQERTSQLILAAAIIDDVLGLLVLALVSSLAAGDVNVLGLLLTASLAAGFTIIVAKWGTRTVGHVVPRIEQNFQAGEVQFNVSMVLLFGLSLLAVYAGVAAIIGAFLAGMALSETVSERVHDLTHGVTELLVPFFLAGIGLHLNLSSFANSQVLWLSVVILLAAVLSKLAGCGLGAFRMGRRAMLQVGAGMVPRGEVGMVVAQIGAGLGVITGDTYAVVVFMAVLTTMAAPPLLNWAFRDTIPAVE